RRRLTGLVGVHVVREIRARQQRPAMTARNVIDAAVSARRVVEADPTSEMCQRLCARPIGIILMPCDDPAVLGRLAEELIVPEAHRAAEELRGRHGEAGMPE